MKNRNYGQYWFDLSFWIILLNNNFKKIHFIAEICLKDIGEMTLHDAILIHFLKGVIL